MPIIRPPERSLGRRVERDEPDSGEAATPAGALMTGQTVTLRVNAAVLATVIVGVLVALIAAWTFGFRAGERRASREAMGNPVSSLPREPVETAGGRGVDVPGSGAAGASGAGAGSDAGASDGLGAGQDGSEAGPGVATGAGGGNPATGGNGPIITAKGTLESDPRKSGVNYQVLGYGLSREEAKSAVEFLAANGVAALGVPVRAVDRGGRAENNSALYKVVSANGISSEAFKRSEGTRLKMDADAKRLGAAWQKQEKGRFNFASPYWEKFAR